MPAELFRNVVTRRAAAGHRLSAVPLTVAFHAVLLAVVVVVPLVGYDVLPVPPVRLMLESSPMPVVPVPPPAPPRRFERAGVPQPSGPSIPVVPPRGIGPGSGLAQMPAIRDLDVIDVQGVVDGVYGGSPDLLAPPLPPEPSRPIRPIRVSDVQPPVRVHYQAPVYPEMAVRARVEGTVTIEAIISTTGAVQDARVLTSVMLLDDAALAAVRQWVYRPTLLNGVPVPVIMTVKVEFKLR